MKVNGRLKLQKFWKKHQRAGRPLQKWLSTVKEAEWNCFADVRRTFGSADLYAKKDKKYVIFNAGGNKYRIVAAVNYGACVVIIIMILSHKEYDKRKWKAKL